MTSEVARRGPVSLTNREVIADEMGMRGHAPLPFLFLAALLALATAVIPLRAGPAEAPALAAGRAAPRPAPAETAWPDLEREIRDLLRRHPGRVGVVVRDRATGRTVRLRAHEPFPSASLAKIPVMLAVEAAVERGDLSLDDPLVVTAGRRAGGAGILKRRPAGTTVTVGEALDLMIARSDNTATNLLVDLVGMDAANEAARALGADRTVMRRDVMDLRALGRGVENRTTPEDLARLLEAIDAGVAVSPVAAARMRERLLAQRVRDRIPRHLPDEVPVAHKTGLMRNVVADAGIVYPAEDRPVTVVVLVERHGRREGRAAKALIARIAAAAFRAAADS
jgi:beta-lactamase class A